MHVGGQYVGLGEGVPPEPPDSTLEIAKIKTWLKVRFTPARITLDNSPIYTHALTMEVARIQRARVSQGKLREGEFIPGVINLATKVAFGYYQPTPKALPIIFTVEGHMSDMFIGPCASTASQLEKQQVCHWKPVGDWDTLALPFKNGTGVEALFRQLSQREIEGPPVDPNNWDGPKIMWPFPAGTPWGIIGFSQGAMVVCEFMWKYVLPENATLHYRLNDFKRGLMFGNPRRAKDAVCGWAQSPPNEGTHGIMDKLFDAGKEGIGEKWAEHPNDEDMFAEVDDDAAGKDQTAIAKIITENKWAGSPATLFSRIVNVLGHPFKGGYGALKASFDAISFLAKNPNPHYSTYSTPGDVAWMDGVAR